MENNPDNDRYWQRKLCNSCPVPELVLTSNSRDLSLEGVVKQKFLRSRVEVTFAICGKHMLELSNAKYCPKCAQE
ncbi:MAG: hypothetical protein R3A44_27720 [Caldilineaceae bacterium]